MVTDVTVNHLHAKAGQRLCPSRVAGQYSHREALAGRARDQPCTQPSGCGGQVSYPRQWAADDVTANPGRRSPPQEPSRVHARSAGGKAPVSVSASASAASATDVGFRNRDRLVEVQPPIPA